MQRFAYTLYVRAWSATTICIIETWRLGENDKLSYRPCAPWDGKRLNLRRTWDGWGRMGTDSLEAVAGHANALQASMSNPCDSTLMKAWVKAASAR